MTPIQIQLLAGPGAGRKASFTTAPITFGREPDNTLVVGDNTASRKHGEIRLEGEDWVLVNLSPNGTRVNRRRVADQPLRLRDGDDIYIGDQLVFRVGLEAPPPAPKPGQAAAAKQAKAPVNKKARLWLWLSAYVALALLGLAFVITLVPNDDKTKHVSSLVDLKPPDIERVIRQRLPSQADPDKARTSLEQATQQYHAIARPTDYYSVYRTYLQALAYAGNPDSFDHFEDWHNFRDVQEKLIDVVKQQYQIACKTPDPKAKFNEFNKVINLYPDSLSEIYANAVAHQQETRVANDTHRGPF